MILRAWVCKTGGVHLVHGEGTLSFRDVFTRRREGCRYAVVEMGREFVAYDMFDILIVDWPELILPRWCLSFPTIEAAMMAVTLTYKGREE